MMIYYSHFELRINTGHLAAISVVILFQKYQHYGNEVSLAMSADATCRGLRSATDGPFLLEFTKGTTFISISMLLFLRKKIQ